MTSNTTPSGEAFASVSNSYAPYKAFNNYTSGNWSPYPQTASNQYIGYMFDTPKKVLYAEVKAIGGQYPKNVTLQASNNKTSGYVDISNKITLPLTTDVNKVEATKNIGKYQYYRFYVHDFTDTTGETNTWNIATLQFYGN